jgi:hypothetical protein
MLAQPYLHSLMFVGGVVVSDHMDGQTAGRLPVDLSKVGSQASLVSLSGAGHAFGFMAQSRPFHLDLAICKFDLAEL